MTRNARLQELFNGERDDAKHGCVIRAVDVRKVYRMGGEETHALRGATLDVIRGEYLSNMGPSARAKRLSST